MTRASAPIIVLSFLAALGGAGLVALLHMRTARAQAAHTWEQRCSYLNAYGTADVVNGEASRLGAQGWELAAMSSVGGGLIYCFKRPVD